MMMLKHEGHATMNVNALHASLTKRASGAIAFQKYDDFPATSKYVEHYITHMNVKLALTRDHASLSFDDKIKMRDICDILQRKQDYAYKHANFNISDALIIIDAYKHAR